MNFFGEQIEKERKLANLSVSDLSSKSGLDESTIMKLESGELFPNMNHLTKISKAFNKNIGYFLKGLVYGKRV